MSEEIWVALITTVGLVLVAIAGAWGNQIRKTLSATHEQVVNDHGDKPNLRHDVDEIKDGLQTLLAWRIRHDDEAEMHKQRTAAVESALLLAVARLGEGENRFVAVERRLGAVDDRLDAHAARIRQRKDDL